MEIKLFQVNDYFFEFPEKGQWVIDGGVELVFAKGICCMGWNSREEIMAMEDYGFNQMFDSTEYMQLENDNILKLKSYLIQEITNIEFITREFDFIKDYTMTKIVENRVVGMNLEFENGSKLQIAFINYQLEESDAPKDYYYDVTGELLVSIKGDVEIDN
ncbi:hypothetical protein POV27_06315 [Aureisphaera galaxeae]|uniref:hypothetical protein n=1 Tax=Aureisphaera galaxeae TaxID=1538023 RepID=UPI002350296E|nr:hypothetical protein [Aureisphaera galaxeae]MDC8003658.1 hypothetical protein [Aureisphaera galaxeae]